VQRAEFQVGLITVSNWDSKGAKDVPRAVFEARLKKSRDWYYNDQKWFEQHKGSAMEAEWKQRYFDLEATAKFVQYVEEIAKEALSGMGSGKGDGSEPYIQQQLHSSPS